MSVPEGTCMEYLFFILKGMKRYVPGTDQRFLFPVRWMLIYLYLLYTVLHYPYRDLSSSFGNDILIRGQCRKQWWYSKCTWNLVMVTLFWGIMYTAIALFCLLTGESMHFSMSVDIINNLMDIGTEMPQISIGLMAYTLYMPFLTAVSLSLLEMYLSLFLRPVFSFGAVAVLLVLSSYYFSPLLVGSYAMTVRSAYIVEGGMLPLQGVLFNSFLIMVCVCGGAYFFERYDILNRPEM